LPWKPVTRKGHTGSAKTETKRAEERSDYVYRRFAGWAGEGARPTRVGLL
jgi:hypothetical protein